MFHDESLCGGRRSFFPNPKYLETLSSIMSVIGNIIVPNRKDKSEMRRVSKRPE